MRRAMVRHGDPTTTGGFVMAYSSGMFDDGKRIAVHGEEATCGNCKGSFKIFGTGTDTTDNGRPTVLHSDPVMCPCGKNKAIAGGDAGCFVESGGGATTKGDVARISPVAARFSAEGSPEDTWHWIGFALRDEGSCEGLHCAAHFADGSIEMGTFNARNTVRFSRPSGSPCTKVDILVDSQGGSNGAATESLLSAMAGGSVADSFAGSV